LSVEWSIAVEWASYLLLPFFILCFRTKIAFVVLSVCGAFLFIYQNEISWSLGETFFLNRQFAVGALGTDAFQWDGRRFIGRILWHEFAPGMPWRGWLDRDNRSACGQTSCEPLTAWRTGFDQF
jgi:peptidoglycan/LPS O-acetylase OafA/YrhL